MSEKLFRKAIEVFGEDAQVLIAIEEMAELTQQLAKYINGRNYSKEGLLNEIADVTIMLEQLILVFDVSPLDLATRVNHRLRKLERLVSKEAQGE